MQQKYTLKNHLASGFLLATVAVAIGVGLWCVHDLEKMNQPMACVEYCMSGGVVQ